MVASHDNYYDILKAEYGHLLRQPKIITFNLRNLYLRIISKLI
jgi:hypothetical protein